MDCRQIQTRFTGYVDGDLRPAERRLVEKHVADCEPCRTELAAMRAFLSDCHEFLVYDGPAYSFESLCARMAAIEPLDEVIAFLPKLRINGFVPRFAVAMTMLMLISGMPQTLRNSRHVYHAVQLSFASQTKQWDDKYQDQLDQQYRNRLEKMGHGQPPLA